MKYKEYSKDLWKILHKTLDTVLTQDPNPIAAFDADGTLWDLDLGESLFQYEIDNKLLSLPPSPWEHYLKMKAAPEGPQSAYLWLAQIHKGISLATVQKWAQQCLQELKPFPLFQEQKKWIDFLHAKGVQVYVVTASVKWAVEPGAALYSIPAERVLGVKTKIKNQLVTDLQEGSITYKSGKAEALLQATGGKKPFFVSGNTEGDLALLELSTHLRLAVSAASRDDRLFRSESELFKIAHSRNWWTHRFLNDGDS